MDRLSAVAAMCALAACSSDADRTGGPRERVNAVRAAPADRVDPAAMCDVFHSPGDAPVFAWPALAGEAPVITGDHWHWINLWATWCKPCVDELPRLLAWRGKLGSRVALHFVSADRSDDDITAYRAGHPRVPDTARLADPDGLAGWLATLGIAGGSLPVHIFLDPAGKIRCVRASAVEDTDYPAVDALLR